MLNSPPERSQHSGMAGILCVIVPQDPPESTLYFTARFGRADTSGGGAFC